MPTSKLSSSRSLDRPGTERIRKVANFGELYTLGQEVMPCVAGTDVHFAVRKKDGLECVIKRRRKTHSFRTKADEISWRKSTEYLMNLPEAPNIAKIYEVLEDARTLYVVMEEVSGVDLYEVLRWDLPFDDVREIIKHLLHGVAHLHSNSVVHKDLKLENVMVDTSKLSFSLPTGTSLTRSGSSMSPACVKVIDFDTMQQYSPSRLAKDVVGTDQYIAQEAYAGMYSPRSDIFAVGVIAYLLLAHKFPFDDQMLDARAGQMYVGSPKMQEIQKKLQATVVDFSLPVFEENPDATDLVKSMMSHMASARPSALTALAHPWVNKLERPSPMPTEEWSRASSTKEESSHTPTEWSQTSKEAPSDNGRMNIQGSLPCLLRSGSGRFINFPEQPQQKLLPLAAWTVPVPWLTKEP